MGPWEDNGKEFKEFKELQEFKERSQEPESRGGRAEVVVHA
jgi:hypothetical protein